MYELFRLCYDLVDEVYYLSSLSKTFLHDPQNHSFETRSGRSIRNPVDSGPEPGRVDKKTGEGKTRCDPADLPGQPGDPAKPGQDPVTNLLTFVFFF